MTTANRKDAREALAQYLKATIQSAEGVFSYQVSDFAGKSPVVYVTSSGSARRHLTGRGLASTFTLNVHTFVLYPSEQTGSGYTEQDAENILDDLEREIADAVDNIVAHPVMKAISYSQSSNADNIAVIGGETYLHEMISVEVSCF